MKPILRQAAVFLALVSLYFSVHREIGNSRASKGFVDDDTIEFQGHAFRTARHYEDYDDYKNDPDNLRPADLPLIQKLAREARVPAYADSFRAFLSTADKALFPGYGSASMNGPKWPDGSRLHLYSIETPGGQDRNFLLLMSKPLGDVRVLDDFLCPTEQGGIIRFETDNRTVRYYDGPGPAAKLIHETPLPNPGGPAPSPRVVGPTMAS